MAKDTPIILSVLAVAILAWQSSSRYPGRYDGSFVPIENNISRQGYLWPVPWPGKRVDVSVFLMNFDNDYLLIDVGAPGQEYEKTLLRGLEKAMGENGMLRLVLLTHGHIDHIGAMKAVMRRHPDALVALHEHEAPYVTGGVPYNAVPSDHDGYHLSFFDVRDALPEKRVLHLKGSSGDVADAFSPTGHSEHWLPPRGAVQFYHAPGHAPGLVAFLHKATGALIAGDVFTNIFGEPPALALAPNAYTANLTQSRLSAKALLPGVDYDRAYCTHDSAAGVSKSELTRWSSLL